MKGFFAESVTKKGHKIAIAGLANDCEKILERLQMLDNCSASINDDVYNIDLALVKIAGEICRDDAIAVAVNINVYDNGATTGAVIGDPKNESSSAEDILEKIGDNLWCYSESGKGGYVLNCAETVARDFFAKTNEINSLADFTRLAETFCVHTYIYVSDATGSVGEIAVSAENIKKSLRF